jgi:hypothetical protein
MVNKENIQINNSKIVYCIIQSRHSNSSKYRVYVKYLPNNNEISSIEGWYCTCKNGARTVGCCSHVSSIIYYCSRLNKYDIKHPANDILKIFPYRKKYETSDDDEEETIKSKKNKNKTLKGKIIKSDSIFSIEYVNDQLDTKMKRLLSSTSICDEENKKQKQSNEFSLEMFFSHVPKWGGQIIDLKNNKIILQNTCTIDYFLLAFWTSFKLSNTFKESIANLPNHICRNNISTCKIILDIIEFIETNNWNQAKSTWIQQIILKNPIPNKQNILTLCTFGNQLEYFLSFVKVNTSFFS